MVRRNTADFWVCRWIVCCDCTLPCKESCYTFESMFWFNMIDQNFLERFWCDVWCCNVATQSAQPQRALPTAFSLHACPCFWINLATVSGRSLRYSNTSERRADGIKTSGADAIASVELVAPSHVDCFFLLAISEFSVSSINDIVSQTRLTE